MKIKAKIKGKDVIIELQPMDGLDFFDIETEFRLGRIKFSKFAQDVIKECIASPVEARDINFFNENPRLLDKIVSKCMTISNMGLSKEEEIEIIEE